MCCGRIEVRRADSEMHDPAALGLQLLGARQDLERGFGAQAVKTV